MCDTTFTIEAVRPLKATFGGRSLWSDVRKRNTEVRKIGGFFGDCIIKNGRGRPMLLVYINAFIPKKYWDVDNDGLIYTDKRWEREFSKQLASCFPKLKNVKDISYTEQGQQGSNYVSLCGQIFGKSQIIELGNALGVSEDVHDLFEELEKEEDELFA